MATLEENLTAFLLADAPLAALVGDRVHAGHAEQEEDEPYLIFFRAGTDDERTTDQTPGNEPFRNLFDVEIYGTDVAAVHAVAAAVKACCDCYVGTFGDSTVKAIFVEDHTDNYVPKNLDTDEVTHFAALQLEIVR